MRAPGDKVEDALQELAELEVQRRLWLASSGEASSFTEAVCLLFDDSGLARALERNEVVYGVRVDAVLRRLGKAVQAIDESQDPVDLLADPMMETVRELAAQALLLLQSR